MSLLLQLLKSAWRRQYLSYLLLSLILVSTSGCVIGIKEKVRIVYVTMAETPIETQGAIKIATSRPVEVTIEGKTDIDTKMDLGGYYAIRGTDLKELLRHVKTTP